MIQVTPQMRILLAVAPVDFRRGMDELARLCREVLQTDPFSGAAFVFRNRRATAIKVLIYDGQGFWLMHNHLSSYYSSFDPMQGFRGWRRSDGVCSISQPVPPTALLDRQIVFRELIHVRVSVDGVSRDDPMLGPAQQRPDMDSEACSRFLRCQQPAVAKSIVARAEPIAVHDVRDPRCGEASMPSSGSGRSARLISLRVEKVCDLIVGVLVEELVDELDDLQWRGNLLGRGLRIEYRQRLGPAALEADVDPGGSFRRELDERGVFDDVGEQPFTLPVGSARLSPELPEVRPRGRRA
jgi:hypothetical protein